MLPIDAGADDGGTCRSSNSFSTERSASRSSNEVDRGEQRNPNNVDEMPVVRDDDRGGGLRRGELTHRGAGEQEDEGDQTTDDVKAVEAGRQVEHRAVGAAREGGAVLDKGDVLVALTADEEGPHQEGDEVPPP